MWLYEREWTIQRGDVEAPGGGSPGLLARFGAAAGSHLRPGEYPVRFVVSETRAEDYRCEVGILATGREATAASPIPSIFEFRKRSLENTDAFNVVLLVPTGVNAAMGGHAGDAGPLARLVAGVADTLITHPNVVNGSDINEMPENALYVEGSVICRLLMGAVGLQRVRSNRLLLVIDRHEEVAYTNAAINALNAARACYGLECPRILVLDPPVKLISTYTSSGRAAGRVDNLPAFLDAIEPYAAEYDAVAVSSVIDVPAEYHQDYFDSAGEMVNPWGGVEAIFTHALSLLRGIPSAHSPMIESEEVEAADPGVVDPRMAAEAVSLTFLQSILKGLKRSPRIVTDPSAMQQPSVLSARDVACVIVPDGCLGLPVLAAMEQGIAVIAVRDPGNLMHNDLAALPWKPGQFCVVENYLEAVGVLCALKAGLALDSVRRPILPAPVTEVSRTTGGARKSRRVPVARQWRRSTPGCNAMTTAQITTRTLVAIDLTGSEEYGRLWRRLATATRVPREFFPGLPVGGLATAAGHWFSETEGRLEAGALRVEVLPPGQPGTHPRAKVAAATTVLDHRQFPKVLLSAKFARRFSPAMTNGLGLEIGRDWACVSVDPSAWPAVAAPTLLTISLCWRLIEIVRQLDRHADWVRDASLHPATPWTLPTRQRRQELDDRIRAMRSLVIDLPCFEGPLIDPRGYFTSRRSARLYRILVKRLELSNWRSLIDDRIEIIEASLGAMIEERRHRHALSCEVVLEVLILAALAADIALSRFPAVLGSS